MLRDPNDDEAGQLLPDADRAKSASVPIKESAAVVPLNDEPVSVGDNEDEAVREAEEDSAASDQPLLAQPGPSNVVGRSSEFVDVENGPPEVCGVHDAVEDETEIEPDASEPLIPYAAPERMPLPIDIVVRNINQVVGYENSDDSDLDADADAVREVNHYLKQEGFKVTQKLNGADCEMVTCSNGEAGPSSSSGFKKGHRRAWSMPGGQNNKRILAVVDNDEESISCNQRRHIVRYRLHPYKPKNSELHGQDVHIFDESALPPADEDDDELEIEVNEEDVICFPRLDNARKGTRTIARKFWEAKWKAQNFEFLPEWLQDNEFLRTGHRPPLPSFFSCFKSIFSVHTETGNIWTHMYGCAAFIGIALWFLTRPSFLINWMDKLVFSSFFAGAIICLAMSFAFHTVQCHSVEVGKLFSKLDYAGITLLIVGSFIPWIYYGFYCRLLPMVIYMTMISVLGMLAMIVSLWDKFGVPKYRPLRATVFVAMGLSSIVPAFHLLITDGLDLLFAESSLLWLLLMGAMYLIGAAIYAFRIPERFFPGKCDIWFQSHQLFHTCVNIAALIHFHGITVMAQQRLEQGSCDEQLHQRYGTSHQASFMDEWFASGTP